jgi:hypothetical protein
MKDQFDSVLTSIILFVLLWKRRLKVLFFILQMVCSVSKLWRKPKTKESNMNDEVMGIEELKKVAVVVAKIFNIGGEMMRDGKIDWQDSGQIMPLSMLFPSLSMINWGQVIPEAKDLSQSEALELLSTFNSALVLPQQNVEVTIELVLGLIISQAKIINDQIALVQKGLAIFYPPTV